MALDVKDRLVEILTRFITMTSIRLPDDVVDKLNILSSIEKDERARFFYDAVLRDLELAEELSRPCCQDTGIPQFFVKMGTHFPHADLVESSIIESVRKATRETPLRPNCVEVFDEVNTGSNVGTHVPWIDWQPVPDSDALMLYLYLAGGGCSLAGKAQALMPLEGYEGVFRFVFDQISSYGVNACPPLLVGVGIAGTIDMAAKLSKLALLRPIGSSNPSAKAHELEIKLENGLNHLGLGPGGIGGRSSVMGVHIEQAGRHPATLAVAVSAGCWAHRRAQIIISPNLEYQLITHKELSLE